MRPASYGQRASAWHKEPSFSIPPASRASHVRRCKRGARERIAPSAQTRAPPRNECARTTADPQPVRVRPRLETEARDRLAHHARDIGGLEVVGLEDQRDPPSPAGDAEQHLADASDLLDLHAIEAATALEGREQRLPQEGDEGRALPTDLDRGTLFMGDDHVPPRSRRGEDGRSTV